MTYQISEILPFSVLKIAQNIEVESFNFFQEEPITENKQFVSLIQWTRKLSLNLNMKI